MRVFHETILQPWWCTWCFFKEQTLCWPWHLCTGVVGGTKGSTPQRYLQSCGNGGLQLRQANEYIWITIDPAGGGKASGTGITLVEGGSEGSSRREEVMALEAYDRIVQL